MKTFSIIEPLEARVAPASFACTDVDGDPVKITASRFDPAAPPLDFHPKPKSNIS